MRNGCSTFADGWPGGGLLVQRLVTGGTLIYRGVACLTANTICGTVVAESIGEVAGILSIAGLGTPVTGAVVAILEACRAFTSPGKATLTPFLSVLGATLAAIHNASTRYGRPFMKVNCAAIPLDMLESELFGATRKALSRERLHNGWAVSSWPREEPSFSMKSAISGWLCNPNCSECCEREFERVGNCRTQKVDVRVVAATQRDLGEMVRNKQFRSHLSYRLNVFPVPLPALRDRRERFELLATHFVKFFSDRMGTVIHHIPAQTLAALMSYPWPETFENFKT